MPKIKRLLGIESKCDEKMPKAVAIIYVVIARIVLRGRSVWKVKR